MRKLLIITILIVSYLPSVVWANIINGGFETGNFVGWEVTISYYTWPWPTPGLRPAGSAQIESTHTPQTYYIPRPTYTPIEGQFFADIATDNVGTGGLFDPYGNLISIPNGVVASARQSVYFNEGDFLSGWVAFLNGDYKAQDETWIKIYDSSTGIEIANPWYARSGGDFSAGPWTYWQWIAPTTGYYTIELAALSRGDDEFDSHILVDGIRVPEPTTMLLLGLGLMGLAGVRKKL